MRSAHSEPTREKVTRVVLRVFQYVPIGALAASVVFDAFAVASGNMRWAHISVIMIAAAITGL